MDGGDTQTKVKWTDTPAKKITVRKVSVGERPKGEAGINLYPQICNS